MPKVGLMVSKHTNKNEILAEVKAKRCRHTKVVGLDLVSRGVSFCQRFKPA